jgi:ribonuclease VapC
VTVLDASAVLAYLQGEPGAAAVEPHLRDGVIGAANWAEVLGRLGAGLEVSLADAILTARGVEVEPVTKADAVTAARIRERATGLSLGDRLCLALGERLGVDVLTADRAWGTGEGIVQIR